MNQKLSCSIQLYFQTSYRNAFVKKCFHNRPDNVIFCVVKNFDRSRFRATLSFPSRTFFLSFSLSLSIQCNVAPPRVVRNWLSLSSVRSEPSQGTVAGIQQSRCLRTKAAASVWAPLTWWPSSGTLPSYSLLGWW